MNLVNFHTYEKNSQFVTAVPVMHESQGNTERYFVSITGHKHNRYQFIVKNVSTNEVNTIIIREVLIEDWTIKECCLGKRSESWNELTFYAIGSIVETDTYVYLRDLDRFVFNKLTGRIPDTMEEIIFEVLDITVSNNKDTDFTRPEYTVSNMLYTRCFYQMYRCYVDSPFSRYVTVRNKILNAENPGYITDSDDELERQIRNKKRNARKRRAKKSKMCNNTEPLGLNTDA